MSMIDFLGLFSNQTMEIFTGDDLADSFSQTISKDLFSPLSNDLACIIAYNRKVSLEVYPQYFIR